MDDLDNSQKLIPEESVAAAVEFAADFSRELRRYSGRLTGTSRETACARAIRTRLERETDIPARMEAFWARPSLGRGCFYLLGIWFLLSYALYYVSFAGGRLAGILLTLVALVNFIVGSVVILLLFFGNGKLSVMLGKAISYNVVSEFCKNRDRDVKERVIVVADSHDSVQGSALRDGGKLRELTVWICMISAAAFVVFCILKMAIGTEAPDVSVKITLFTVLPAISGVFGISAALFHYSPLARHAKDPNGASTCVAMATYAYFAEQPELLPDDVRIVYASFGGENSAHGGEETFRKAHPEFADAYVLCFGELSGAELKLAEYDPMRRLGFSAKLASAISGAAHDLGETLTTIPHGTAGQKFSQLHGYQSTAFAAAGIDSATVLSFGTHADEDLLKRAFSLGVRTVYRLFDDMPVGKTESDFRPAPVTDVQMQTISSK